MNAGLSIAVSHEQGRVPVTVFHLKGELNTHTSDQLEAQAEEAFQQGSRDLVLDLSEVSYISSAGLRAIHYIYNLLRQNTPAESEQAVSQGLRDGSFSSPHLKLVSPSPTVAKVLSITGYDMFLQVHPNLEDALASF